MKIRIESITDVRAKIVIMGLGGGGTNIVDNIMNSNLLGVDFVVVNTDAQALNASICVNKLQIGKQLTQGLGAGGDPEIGYRAVLENKEEIMSFIDGYDMVFIIAGMGGGTGTGASAIIATIAKEIGALTIAVVTKPFDFEGRRRRLRALQGLRRLEDIVDTLIAIPNQKLMDMVDQDTSLIEAFREADMVIVQAIKGITDLISCKGLINLDFADIKSVMQSKQGKAVMGTGWAEGINRAQEAAMTAINNDLMEMGPVTGARGIVINISGDHSMTLREVSAGVQCVQKVASEDADIVFGASIDETLNDRIRVTIIATGFDKSLIGEQLSFNEPIDKKEVEQFSIDDLRRVAQEVGVSSYEMGQDVYDIPAFIRKYNKDIE